MAPSDNGGAMKSDPRVDFYIAKAAPFAQPILTHLRRIAHKALPDGEEGIKWGIPHFLLNGKNVAGMSAFTAHCAFVVHGEGKQGSGEGMGAYGKITSMEDMPGDAELTAAIKAAAERVKTQGSATKRSTPRKPKPEIPVPDDFAAALAELIRQSQRSTPSPPPTAANIWNGSRKPNDPKREQSVLRKRLNGWLRARSATGSMKIVEAVLR